MNPSRLNGKKVIGAEGLVIGEVEGVDLDFDAWHTSTLYVRLSDDAAAGYGLKNPFMSRITICLPTRIVKSVGDVIVLGERLSNLDGVARECLVNPIRLKGKTVEGANGYIVGEVEAVDLEPSNWQVTGLQVSLTKDAASELGFSKSFLSKVVVVIPTEIVGSVGNMVTLNENVADLKALAKCLECS